LTDSTHHFARRAVALLALLAVGFAANAATARADGDPASDVLATQALFLPQDAGVPAAQAAQLGGLLRAAAQAGYPIRVALIASASDLGSVTELWRKPQTYARFLGQELGLVYKGPLVVVMPNGVGVTGVPPGSVPDQLATARNGSPLAAGAMAMVVWLASSAGHRLTVPSVAAPAAAAGSSDATTWLAFVIGAVLIALAWTFSMRARPLRSGRHST
jgi:hypothetical protein